MHEPAYKARGRATTTALLGHLLRPLTSDPDVGFGPRTIIARNQYRSFHQQAPVVPDDPLKYLYFGVSLLNKDSTSFN